MAHRLAGRRILVVEDGRIVAEDLTFEITVEGGEVVGPVETVSAALNAIANTDVDGATLDIKLLQGMSFEVADALADRHIPFVFLTAYGADAVPARHADVIRLEKPTTPAVVCRTLERILAARWTPS
jgi:DNA-binding LytR/AlgR family response regulator